MAYNIVTYRCFPCIAAICILILWFIILQTTNNYYSSTYDSMKKLQVRILESKFSGKLHKDTLVDLEEFEYLINNASMCTTSESDLTHSSIVIMIHTARHHFDRRYAIRSTWGSVKMYRQWRLHLIFLLGSDPTSNPNSYTEKRIWDESSQFGDLIMGNFVDSYRNLSYKHLMGYKWVSTFCPTAKYILKTDDDIFADIFQVIDVLLWELVSSEKTYVCENMGGNKPSRVNNSKWYVSEAEFAGEMYPDFCSGSAYIVKADDASKIYSISNKTTFLWVDDAFVTGVLRAEYEKLVDAGKENSLQIYTVFNRHHLGDKRDITKWCAKDLSTEQLNFAFVLLNDNEFIRDMFCIWNKVRLMRFAMNIGLINPKIDGKEIKK